MIRFQWNTDRECGSHQVRGIWLFAGLGAVEAVRTDKSDARFRSEIAAPICSILQESGHMREYFLRSRVLSNSGSTQRGGKPPW
jgi:hypothetical protein